MRDLLVLIVKNIATKPEEVQIDESTDGNLVTYTITVGPDDMGRIIGKSGKVIKSIRNIAHVAAIRQGKRFRINVAEVGGQPASQDDSNDLDNDSENVVYNPSTETTQASADPEVQDNLVAEALDDTEDSITE